jgi:RimJ/RimL family protein N-acetyltransferase
MLSVASARVFSWQQSAFGKGLVVFPAMLRPPEIFATGRLLAQRPRAEDAPAAFAAYASDPAVTRFLTWKAYDQVEPLAEFFRARNEDCEKNGAPFAWLLRLRDDGEMIGTIGCTPDGGKISFGYALGRNYWGRGLAAEALRHLVDWSLAQPGIYRAWAFCDVENPASARVMEKASMTREGLLRRWHVCPTIGPEPRDCFVYARVK